MISPDVIQKYFPNNIYFENLEIKTASGNIPINKYALIPCFRELRSNGYLKMIILKFHKFYDGIIGLDDLRSMQFNLNLSKAVLYRDSYELPMYYQKIDSFNMPGKSKVLKKVLVNYVEGDVLIEGIMQDEIYVPSCITTVNKGEAIIEVQNWSNDEQSFKMNTISAIPLENFHIFQYQVNDVETIDRLNGMIRTDHLNQEEKSEILKLCKHYKDLFKKPEDTLTCNSDVMHEIKTKDNEPIFQRARRFPHAIKTQIKEHIDKLLKENIIRPSQSPWGSPVNLVSKKLDASGTRKTRLVIDYRAINEKTVDDRYPIPNIEDILDKLGRCQYFTTLDLASGYHQIKMHPESITKTAFNTEFGHHEFLRMPFGLKNSPATFQRVMDDVLKDILNKYCMVYLDDIIIFSPSLEEHIKHLKSVFDRLRNANLKLQLDKCEFLRKETEYLGHVITPNGIKPNPKKIQVIQNFPIPKTQKEIRSFLGLLGYYRKFIKNFAKVTKPLTKCLKKGETVTLTPEFKDAFENCKTLLCNDPILKYPDFDKQFELTTDASNFAIGAILSQDEHPIAYASKTLNPAETNYSTIEKEMLAIVWACRHFRPYLYGTKFVIKTDHKPLQWLFSVKDPSSRLTRWRLKLMEYDYEIRYKKGKNNQADALSRIKLTENYVNTLNPDTTDIDAESLLVHNDDEAVDLTQDELDELLEQLPEDSNQRDEEVASTGNTIHSANGDIEITIPYTEKILNLADHQIILDATRNLNTPIFIRKKIFDKTRVSVTLPLTATWEIIVKALKDCLSPEKKNVIYFKHKNIERDIIKMLQESFVKLKIEIANKIVQDIEKEDEQKEKIKYYHEGKTSHRGINEVYQSLRKNYYWPNQEKSVSTYINNCETCQLGKYDRTPQKQPISHTYTPKKPFEQLHIDLLFMNNRTILTIVDHFSKYGQAYLISDKNANTIINGIIRFTSHHGLCRTIIVDSGKEFDNILLKEFCKLHKIQLHITSVGNSKSNGVVERFHSTLTESIRCRLLDHSNTFENQLVNAVLGYNNSLHSSTKFTPFEVINGHLESNLPFDIDEEKLTQQFITDRAAEIKVINNQISNNLEKTKQQTCDKVNANRKEIENIKVGQEVYVRKKLRNKLKPKFGKEQITNVSDKTIHTQKNRKLSKEVIKKKRKFTPDVLLQDEANIDNPSDSHNQVDEQPTPSTSN